MHILAYGGGDIRQGETRFIDEKVISEHGLTRPRILLIAAGLHNNAQYQEAFLQYAQNQLKGEAVMLDLDLQPKSETVIEELYNRSDVIYIGPGDTQHLMNCMETNNFDRWLIRALKEDKLIIGLSAGANSLFKSGIHDHKLRDQSIQCNPIEGLGFIQLCFSPHYDMDAYQESMLDYISEQEERGIVCDEGSAFEIKGTSYRCHSFRPEHHVRLLYIEQEELVEEELSEDIAYASLLGLID